MKSQKQNIMKQFNLDEYLANPSKKVVTRDGRKVRIRCTNYNSPQPIIAEIEGSAYSSSFWRNGRVLSQEESPGDLFFASESHEGWINIYKARSYCYGGSVIYPTEVAAKTAADPDPITTIKIEWEE